MRSIVESTITNLSQRPGKSFFPHSYVFRRDKRLKPQLGELSNSEHCWDIMQIVSDPALPQATKPQVMQHLGLEEVLENSREYDWAGVRRWSEECFAPIAVPSLRLIGSMSPWVLSERTLGTVRYTETYPGNYLICRTVPSLLQTVPSFQPPKHAFPIIAILQKDCAHQCI